MDEWDVISSAVGGVLGTVVGGPVGGLIGGAGGLLPGLLSDSPPGTVVVGKPPPYPGSTPGVPPYPGMPPMTGPGAQGPQPGQLPLPPGVNLPGSGRAAEGADAEAKAIAQLLEHLEELDRSATATVEAIHAAGAAGRQALEQIQRDVEAKITELTKQGRLNTPAGQEELRKFLKEKLTAAKQLIDEQIADAEAKARLTRELAHHYRHLAAAGGGDGKAGGGDHAGAGGSSGGDRGGSGGGGGGSDQGTSPASAVPAAPPAAAPTSPFGQGMMPAGMPMPSLPSLGGGGMPGFGGGGDPLSALSGLAGAGAHGHNPGLQDDSGKGEGSGRDGSSTPKLRDEQGSGGEGSGTKPAADHGSGGSGTELVGNQTTHPGGDGPGSGGGQDGGTHVALPDGTSTEARSAQGVTAVKAVLNGATVSDAWHQAGVTVPPPGTPVTAPIPPTQLRAGDVGVWKDHLVMAMGNGKVLVSGQLQPLTSVGSGPDFLGWMDPSAQGGKPGQAPHGAAATPPQQS
jgi:hypothetical protein